MRGTDVTDDQFKAAEDFIADYVIHSPPPAHSQRVTIRWDELVRLLAWYGMIRAIGVERGASANAPGRCEPATPTLKLVE